MSISNSFAAARRAPKRSSPDAIVWRAPSDCSGNKATAPALDMCERPLGLIKWAPRMPFCCTNSLKTSIM